MKPPEDKRPPMVVASQIVHEVTSVGLSMGIFPLGGYWLDQKWETSPWFTITGAIVGVSVGMFQLVNLGRSRPDRKRYPKAGSDSESGSSPSKESKGNSGEQTGKL